MEKKIHNSVKYAKITTAIWKDLKERFGKESAPKAYELKQSLNTTRQDGMTVFAYYTRLRVLWDEMELILPTPRCSCDKCTCGLGKKLIELKEKDRTYEFLMGLEDHEEEQTHSMEDVLEEQPEDLVEEEQNMQSVNIHAENIHMENHVEPPVIQQEIEEGRQKRQRTALQGCRLVRSRMEPNSSLTKEKKNKKNDAVDIDDFSSLAIPKHVIHTVIAYSVSILKPIRVETPRRVSHGGCIKFYDTKRLTIG
ncbi:putative gag-pre-integrase domain, LTR copia-type gag-polypeptide [Tanacetum coccineum]